MEGTWEMHVQTTRPLSEPWALFSATMSKHVGHTLVLATLTSSEAAATLLKFNTGCVMLVVNARHRSGLVSCCNTCFCVFVALPPSFFQLCSETAYDCRLKWAALRCSLSDQCSRLVVALNGYRLCMFIHTPFVVFQY